MATQRREAAAGAEFANALRAAIDGMREVSGAEIVVLYPYDDAAGIFYAPTAVGLPESDLVASLPDMVDQLARFRADEAQGKIADDLSPASYGPSAWLLATLRPLVTADPAHDIGSSFVRRHHITAMVGLPLRVGARTVGLLYLDYVEGAQVDVTSQPYLERVEAQAHEVALAVDAAREAGESRVLRGISALVSELSRLPSGSENDAVIGARLDMALHSILSATGLGAAAIYAPLPGGRGLARVASHGCAALESLVPVLTASTPEEIAQSEDLQSALREEGLRLVTTLTPRGQGHGAVLLLADRDPLAMQRRLPVEGTLLQTAADLVGGILNTDHLLEELGETSRSLGAVTRLSTRLLQPGANQEETLHTAVAALTDPDIPELNFQFADIFLLDNAPDGGLMVSQSSGATSSPVIDSLPSDLAGSNGDGRRVPVWAAPGTRMLHPRDILAYVATRRRAVVVAPLELGEENFLTGYPEDGLERFDVPVNRADGSVTGHVHAIRLRAASDRAPLRAAEEGEGDYRPTDEITLDADLFAAYGHASLVRIFVPFGSGTGPERRAAGVLEAGYHVSRQGHLERVQIEALRACAAVVAVAVETARVYEDLRTRNQQLEIVTEVSRAIATSIDMEQTLSLVARNMARAVDASICLIALLEEDGSAWYGAASSDMEEVWNQRRVERPERSIVFEVADLGRPIAVEDAFNHELVSAYMARLLGVRSLLALPLQAGESSIGAVLLGQRDRQRVFTGDEVDRALGLAGQAAMAIRNARLHAREEEEHHIQKDVVLVGFGQWGQKAYRHLVLLKNFFNFRIHVVEREAPGRREALADAEASVMSNGDLFYWDSANSPARDALEMELEPSCYVIVYIATPAETHLPLLKLYYDISNVVLIEKPLGAPPEEYRAFLDRTDGSVQIVAADHYWFKIEVRLLELLLTEERNLRAFLDEIEEVEIEILEEQPPGGSGAMIGMIADLVPHALAVCSLITPIDRVRLDPHRPLRIGRYEPVRSEHETYARLVGSFDHKGRQVRLRIDVGKGVANAKWIKLTGPRRMGGRRSFYKFDFTKGEAIDGTQGALRAAVRPVRQPGVPDNAHLNMLRHVVEKKYPAVGILSIREAMRMNARIHELEHMAEQMIASGRWTSYSQGQRPAFDEDEPVEMVREPSVPIDAASGDETPIPVNVRGRTGSE